jgi:hypothetical protein
MLFGSIVPRWFGVGFRVFGVVLGVGLRVTLATCCATGAALAADANPAVVLAVRGDVLDVARLRVLLEKELACAVLLESEPRPAGLGGVVTVSYRREAAELGVAWDSGGRTVTRLVAAPGDPERLLSDSVLLAGNLVHQQVEDLLPAAPLAVPAAPLAVPAAPLAVPAEERPFSVGVFYPLASNHGHPEITSNFDFNLIYGRVGSIEGAQLGAVNVVSRAAGAPVSMAGLEVAFLANVVKGSVDGVQLAGVLNDVSAELWGAQLSLGANLAQGRVTGLQGAFLFNHASALDGLQLSLINVAGDVDGVQLGLINVAHHLRGVSVGLINVADDIDGVPIGPFSVTRTGGVHPLLWSGTGGFGNAGVKFATRHTYSLLFGSYHRAFDLEFVGGGFALGASIALGAGFRADVDLMTTYLVAPALSTDVLDVDGYHEQIVQPRLRMLLAYRAADHLGAFVGLAALGQVRSELGWERVSAQVGPEIFGGIEL